MMRIGRLRCRLVLEAATRNPDGAGGVTRVWSAITEVFASVIETGGSEPAVGHGLAARITHVVVVRPLPGILPRHRFRLGTRSLLIHAVLAADDRTRRVKCLCEERDL